MIGKRIKNIEGSYKEIEVPFYNAKELFQMAEDLINEGDQIKISQERLRYNEPFFWNLIYYFNDY